MHDYYTGLDPDSFTVIADFPIDGAKAGQDLASQFKETSPGVRELSSPRRSRTQGQGDGLRKDRQGNVTRIERTLSVGNGEVAITSSPGLEKKPVAARPADH